MRLSHLLLVALLALAPVCADALTGQTYGAVTRGSGLNYPPAGSDQVLGGTPTLTSCGTSPSVVGDDFHGTITTGTGSPAACTLNFTTTLPGTPVCSIDGWGASVPSITSASATAVVIGGTLGSSVKISYICIQ